MRDVIVLTGPTAVGKTELSLELAEKIDAEIIVDDYNYRDDNLKAQKLLGMTIQEMMTTHKKR